MFNQIEKSEEILIEAEKKGVKRFLEHYYHLLDAMKAADIPSFNISSSELQDATDGIKSGRYVFKTIKLPFDYNPPIPPLVKGGKGGFLPIEKGNPYLLGEELYIGITDEFSKKAFLLDFAKGLDGLGDTVSKYWENSFCPVCGSLPSLGVLGGNRDGGMSLVCSLCETQWDFRRLHCPFCGNDDQKGLGYLYSEVEEGYRINYCDKCKIYLKVVDIRKKGNVYSYPIEDILTLPLDILAQEKGYKRLAPNPLGIVVVK